MRIRSPLLFRLAGIVGAWVVRLWMGSLRYRFRRPAAPIDPHDRTFSGRYIYIFWHEAMLYPAFLYAIPKVKVLISRHSDGEYITQIVRRLGFGVIRGSTNRQGAAALMEMVRHGRGDGHLAVTPDGPRGPRRRLQPGVVYLASKTGLPVVPVGFASRRPWRGTNWDRFQIPRPGSVATVVGGEPMAVPPDLDEAGLEEHRRRIEAALLGVTEEAEAWAERDDADDARDPSAARPAGAGGATGPAMITYRSRRPRIAHRTPGSLSRTASGRGASASQ